MSIPEQKKLFPASLQQQGIWFHAMTHDASYWNVIDFRVFKGNVNFPLLKEALKMLIKRHASLRTHFVFDDHQVWQAVENTFEVEDVIKLKYYNANERQIIEQVVNAVIAEEEKRCFDLQKDKLWILHLLRFKGYDVFLLNISHIINDVVSLQIFWRELVSLYNKLTRDIKPEDDLSTQQFYDWALEQHEYVKGQEYQQKKQRKLAKLSEVLTRLDLPFYRIRDKSKISFKEIVLSTTYVQRIKSFALQNRVVVSAIYQLAYYLLIYGYTASQKLAVANIVGGRGIGRDRKGDIMGLFANRLVNSLRINEDQTIADLLRSVNEDLIESLRDNIPFEELLRDKDHKQRAELLQIQAGFNLIRLAGETPVFDNMEAYSALSFKRNREVEESYDIYLCVTERPENTCIRLELRCEPAMEAMLELVMEKYVQLLERVLSSPLDRVVDIDHICTSEQELYDKFNDTVMPHPITETVIDGFERQVKIGGDLVALIVENEQITYHELDRRSNQLAWYLQKLGIETGSLVGISMDRSVGMLVGLLGILKSGAAFLPIDPAYPLDWMRYVIEDSEVKHLLINNGAHEHIHKLKPKIISIDSEWPNISQELIEAPSRKTLPEDLAYVIYTSGSTGRPKGVMIEHASLTNFVYAMKQALMPGKQFRMLSTTTFSFDIFYLELFLPLICEGCVVMANAQESKDGQLLFALLEKYRPEFMQATPSAWQMLIDSGSQDFEGLTVLSGGEAINESLKEELFKRRPKKIWNLFGPTETTIWSTCEQLQPNETITIGRPIGNTKIYILDANRNLLPVGVKGDMYIGGAGLARGYLNREDITKERFLTRAGERLYFTGDIARWLPNGKIEYVGRSDNQLKIRGHRVEPGEIENVLSSHKEVKACCVIAAKDVVQSQRLIAYVVSEANTQSGSLKAYLKARLPEYMVPAIWIEMDSLPLSPNGKTDRKALPLPENKIARQMEIVPPVTEIELALANIWKELLDLNTLGIHNDFFELGGHSLIATRIISSIRDALGISLPIKTIFDYKTIHELARYINLIHDPIQSGEMEYEVIDL